MKKKKARVRRRQLPPSAKTNYRASIGQRLPYNLEISQELKNNESECETGNCISGELALALLEYIKTLDWLRLLPAD